jgi:hypothetical protein
MVRNQVRRHLARGLRLVYNRSEIPPLRIPKKILEIAGKPVLDTALDFLGMTLKSGCQGLHQFLVHFVLSFSKGGGDFLNSLFKKFGDSILMAVR